MYRCRVIDYNKCVKCGGCINKCPVDALSIDQECYKVVVGGCGSRHPQLAQTVTECTDVSGVLNILEKTLMLFKDAATDVREISFHEVIKKHSVAELRI